MTFHDLPPNARDLPLDDPRLRSDLIDLIVSLDARSRGCLAVLVLDEARRCTIPVVIKETGPLDGSIVHQALSMILAQFDVTGLVVALGRPGSALFTDDDRAGHQVVVEICRDHGIELLGTYVASDSVVRELPDHLRLAS